MKRILLCLGLVCAAGWAQAQETWSSYATQWQRIDGGPVLPSGYMTISNDDVPVTQRSIINVVGGGCVDNALTLSTDCTFAGGSGAPDTVDYLVGTADAGLSAEIVVGATPGGELGGTWASFTIDDGITVTGWTSINTDTSFNAKGDIMIATANNAASAHTAGANDTIPMYDSGQADGVKNQAPATTEIADSSIVESAGTSDTWARGDHVHRRFSPTTELEIYDEFPGHSVATITSIGSSTGLVNINTGTGAQATRLPGEAGRQGLFALETGSTNAGVCSVRGDAAQYAIDGNEIWEMSIRIPALSTDGVEEFTVEAGFGDGNGTGGTPTDGIWFAYDINTSPNWLIVAKGASTATTTTSGTAVGENVWIRLRWEVNAAATSVEYFVDGVSVGTIATANIPTVTEVTSPFFRIIKSVGTTTRFLHGDYYWFHDVVAR